MEVMDTCVVYVVRCSNVLGVKTKDLNREVPLYIHVHVDLPNHANAIQPCELI